MLNGRGRARQGEAGRGGGECPACYPRLCRCKRGMGAIVTACRSHYFLLSKFEGMIDLEFEEEG